MSPAKRPLLFSLFFVSGLCGLVYQVVWTRMAFAAFGIITPVLSVVISVFMLGLSVGAWAAGRWVSWLVARTGRSAVLFYAVTEAFIGLGAFAVPRLFGLGERALLAAGQSDSLAYLCLSALVLAVAILPWCLFMGATFPLMLAYVREREPAGTESFSYLYLANVLGAMCGTLVTAVALVEIFGFHDTLRVAATANFLIALVALGLARAPVPGAAPRPPGQPDPRRAATTRLSSLPRRFVYLVLFCTGFVAMAMEVVWTRAFAPVLKTQVYSFALVVATYLGATFAGSLWYRRDLRRSAPRSPRVILAWLCSAALLPVVLNDTRLVDPNSELAQHPFSALLVLASICPFCGLLGYLTPALIDDFAAGAPEEAGAAYAVNVLGCILGPLAACYGFLPWLSERHALVLLSLPFLGFFLAHRREVPLAKRWRLGLGGLTLLAIALFYSSDFEDTLLRTSQPAVVRRDYAASVLSCGKGRAKRLLVNGIGMTALTPITKFMVHLPLAFHQGTPKSVLVICFGMGTTYRSALSWGVETTSVELVPSVKAAFGFYHSDAAQCLDDSRGHIIIDDGRRFLKRTRGQYDVIVIDPPPPPEAAGSSLLYSEEFYQLAKQHLKPGGILQAWIPANADMGRAALRSVCNQFAHVRCLDSVEGWGVHVLASQDPMPNYTAAQLAARFPLAAARDLLEWSPELDLAAYLNEVLSHETPAENDLDPNPNLKITDDLPYNEYFLLRKLGWL